MVDIQFFRTPFATVTKAYRGDSGQMYIEGVASSTNLDQTKEKMSPEAIKIMAAGFTGKPLNSEHKNDWDDELGKIVQADVIDKDGKPALWIKAKLNDWMGRAKDLFTGLNDGHLQLGLSVEGKINQGGLVKEFDETLGQYVPVYKDITPAAVAITNKPANLDTFVDAVTKSIKIDELPEAKQGSYIIVRKVVDGTATEETVCKDELCEHQKCLNKTCKNTCENCLTKDAPGIEDGQPTPIENQTLDCGHPVCAHGQCLEKGCKNMCKVCMAAKVNTQAAGPVPETLLARQDLAGKEKTDTTETKKAEVIDAGSNTNIDNPPIANRCTHDYCVHGNCFEKGCVNECPVCKDGAVEAELLGKAKEVTGAHETKPAKYQDVAPDKFLDPENFKYPADENHLAAALAYFNHSGQREAGGYAPDKWTQMGHKLAGFLGHGYHYDASSETVVHDDDEAKKSTTEGGEIIKMLQNVLQKTPYNPEVLDIIKAWGGNNPGNQELIAKATASVGSSQQTVQKGSSSSDKSSSDDSSSSGSSSSPSSSSTSSDSTSSRDSLSSLLSSVLTTLSDMKSSVSGSSPSSSSDDSTDSSTSTSSKTSTDKAMSFGNSDTDKTSTDKAFNDATDVTSSDSSDYDEATKALSLALASFQAALEKTKKQPPTGKFAENGTQHQGAAKEGKDSVNGPAQEPNERTAPHDKVAMPKGDTGSTDHVNGPAQEPDYNSLAGSDSSSSVKRSMANQDKFVKSIDTMIALMQKLGDKVEAVEGKVDSMPSVRKGIAIDKQFTEEEKAEFAKSEGDRKTMEGKLLADPKVGFKELHLFRATGILPAGYQA